MLLKKWISEDENSFFYVYDNEKEARQNAPAIAIQHNCVVYLIGYFPTGKNPYWSLENDSLITIKLSDILDIFCPAEKLIKIKRRLCDFIHKTKDISLIINLAEKCKVNLD